MGWLQNIFKNERRLEEIEIQELELLQEKAKSLMDLLQGIHEILYLAKRAKIDAEASQKNPSRPITMSLPPNEHTRLMGKLALVTKNLEEEIELIRDIGKKEKKLRK